MLMRYRIVVNERSYKATTISTQSIGEQKSRITHPSRLPLCSQLLQLLVITELDEDVDRPFIVVFGLMELNFTRAADTCLFVCPTQRPSTMAGKEMMDEGDVRSKAAENLLPISWTRSSSAGSQLS